MRDILAAEERGEPFGSGLLAGDETFGTELVGKLAIVRVSRAMQQKTHNAGGRVNVTRNSVDGDNVGALIVPRAVLAPICSRHLLPRVVKLML